MLALTPSPLQTAGERAFFAELNRWDTGGAVRSAVVASIPVVEEGALHRRLSDAVLFVAEGIAVVRVVEVVRQSGVVTARPEGAWTIGPGAGPGEVLQLGGGGSTPLDGLMRAGMDAAMRLRRAGLEPGRIARLTVLVGEISGLEPPDGDLGEGDQVALLEPRSLLLGIARAARYAGTDNPRFWTTADVRAALESLGLQGRGPTVDQLNGEGFAYSPYVLRRPELLAPAGIVNAGEATAAAESAISAATAPPAAPGPAPWVGPVAPAASAQTAWPASPPTAWQEPAPPESSVDEDDADGFDSSSGLEDSGIGGLFGSAEPDQPEPPAAGPTRTAVFPAGQSYAPTAPAVGPPPAGSPSFGAGSFGAPPPPAGAPPFGAPPFGGPPVGGPRLLDQRMVEERPPGQGPSRQRLLLIGAALVVVALVVLGGILLFGAGGGSGAAAGHTSAASSHPSAQLSPGAVQEVDGVSFTLQAVKVDDTCVGHAYGAVGDYFNSTNCTGLARALYSAQVDGKPVVLAVSKVRMPNADGARALRALADRDGTGNVSDLLREGVRYDGGPDTIADSQYASTVQGSTVTIVESAWVAGRSAGSSAPLDAVASSGLVLPMPNPGK